MAKVVEIRWHGRGGQGAKTASLLLADAAFNTGKYIQGFPDLTILYTNPRGEPRWALLECKRSENEPHRPNQDFYIGLGDEMAFGRFVYPENKEEVLYDIQQAFQS